jgi:hypothetical protein
MSERAMSRAGACDRGVKGGSADFGVAASPLPRRR